MMHPSIYYVKRGISIGIFQFFCLGPNLVVSACFPVNATACLAVSEGSSDRLLAETTCSGDGGSLAVWNFTTRDFFNDLNEDVWVSNFPDSSANEFRWIDNTPFSGELLFSMLILLFITVYPLFQLPLGRIPHFSDDVWVLTTLLMADSSFKNNVERKTTFCAN